MVVNWNSTHCWCFGDSKRTMVRLFVLQSTIGVPAIETKICW